MRSILFVDDEPHVLEALRDALRPRRAEWQTAFAGDAEAAMEVLEEREFDVVVSDMRMPGTDGAALLAHVQQCQPRAVRIVLSGYAEVNVISRAAAVAHRFLAKPCDLAELSRVVERSCALGSLTHSVALNRAASGATSLPAAPLVHARLTEMLAGGNASIAEVGALVGQDVAMAAKVLQLANSAFFGAGRPIVRVHDAVMHLGLATLRALVLTAGAFSAFQSPRSIEGFSMEVVQSRCAAVAKVASALLTDKPTQEQAFTAGLVHDVGLLVLAAQEADYLGDALACSARERRPLVDVERERRGATHAELGAHLLALWGLPHPILEAVAFHHRPQAIHDPHLDAAAAVGIATALVGEAHTDAAPLGDAFADPLDLDYVERLGATHELPRWREIAAEAAEGVIV